MRETDIPPKSTVGPAVALAARPRPQALDPAGVIRQARRLAAAAQPPWLHAEVARRMAEKLAFIKLQPRAVLDVSAWLGDSSEALRRTYPQARLHWAHSQADIAARSKRELASPWWQLWRRPPAAWRPAAGAVSLVPQLLWANLLLHAHGDLPEVLGGWAELLAPDGFVMFSCFGPDSFVELRRVFAQSGWGACAPQWWDMHDIGDLMSRSGFVDPVLDQERIRLTWADAPSLLADLRALGGNVAPDRFAGLRTPRWRAQLLARLEESLRGSDGRLGLTLELVFGHAFRAPPRPAPGPTVISVESLQAQLRARRAPAGEGGG